MEVARWGNLLLMIFVEAEKRIETRKAWGLVLSSKPGSSIWEAHIREREGTDNIVA